MERPNLASHFMMLIVHEKQNIVQGDVGDISVVLDSIKILS